MRFSLLPIYIAEMMVIEMAHMSEFQKEGDTT